MASQTVPDSDREHRNDIRRSTGGQSMTLAMGKEEDKKRGRGERRAARAWIGRVKGNFPPHCACVEIGFVAEGLPTIGPLVWCMRRVKKGYFFPPPWFGCPLIHLKWSHERASGRYVLCAPPPLRFSISSDIYDSKLFKM
ncbi:hypothetical protein GW17_00004572 [Ensete ventricosum]|nr:hypothetical protein GW17_00004572 [Ensete ventricosum]